MRTTLLSLFIAVGLLVLGAVTTHAQVRDEAARPCPPGLDPGDRTRAWWCGYDPGQIVDDSSDPPRLTAFQEHYYSNIAQVPTDSALDLDWTCIEDACGGLLNPDFILDRELSHLWQPDTEDGPWLVMGREQFDRAVRGRNTWLMWTAGNHGFWDHLARRGYGLADFLKLLDNRYIDRADRFRLLGVINEPGMQPPTETDAWGLRLDVPRGWEGDWPPPPGTEFPPEAPDPYVYGYSSGVMGLRVFPNPDFFYGSGATVAQERWDPDRFLNDTNYSKDPKLIRPYRVGVACGFCHASFNPISPPDNPAEPEWRNISSSVGAQYLKFGRFAAYDFTPTNYLWHLVNSSKPGTVDTSLVATDGINNPTVANGVFGVLPRVANSFRFTETANDDASAQPVLDLSVFGLGLPELPQGPLRHTMRVLAGGSDSVGGRLALTRVYFNIGSYFEYWAETANFLVGIHEQKPFALDGIEDRSVYWNVNLFRTQNMAEFLTYNSGPMRLATAPGGTAMIDLAAADRGRAHFVTHCMACHSTKQPEVFWGDPSNWRKWVNDPAYLAQASEIASAPGFHVANFMATDIRYPVSEIGLNTARFLSDNAQEGRVWHDFSSEEFKSQPVLTDVLKLDHPYRQGETFDYAFNDRTGPARTRPLTLLNMWATAPYLHNNAVGRYPPGANPGNYPAEEGADVSVAGRLKVFETSVEELLHLAPRLGDGSISRTSMDSQFELPRIVLVDLIRQQLGSAWVPIIGVLLFAVAFLGLYMVVRGLLRLARDGFGRVVAGVVVVLGFGLIISSVQLAFTDIHRVGRIPAGTPVSLVSNLNGPAWVSKNKQSGDLRRLLVGLGKVWLFGLDSLDHPRVPKLVPTLLRLNKAPDFVLDRGHDFGGRDVQDAAGEVVLKGLSEAQRRDLIEYLKTL